MNISPNINRIDHLLNLFSMSRGELLTMLNSKRTRLLEETDVFGNSIKISVLKKIDTIFNKGIGYYTDPKDPIQSKEESIFFRKDHFNAELNLGARQIVNRFEEEKLSFSVLAKLSDFNIKRQLSLYRTSDDPKKVANEIRPIIYPTFIRDRKAFLKGLISKLAENNIVVFEFIENHNKIQKANINGFYLSPNVIVLKRNQKSFKREIFTLAHELGHYLLNEEEIDDNINEEISPKQHKLSAIERWCNDFAYYFLAGEYDNTISNLELANSDNDYHTEIIEEVSKHTHLSTISLFTRLLLTSKISPVSYKTVTDNILVNIREWEESEKKKMELEKQKAIDEGRKPIAATAKPIISPLFLQTLQSALYSGLISESEFCKRLNISSEKIKKFR